MRLRGGYDIMLAGRPAGRVEVLPEPDVLYLPLRSRRFVFAELCVKDAQRVAIGHVLARDPENYSVPLLAPREGTVRLDAVEGHIVLDETAPLGKGPSRTLKDAPHVPKDLGPGSVGMKRYKLLELGAWQFMYDAHTQSLPDPFSTPRAVIVSAMCLEPFGARGDVQLHKRLSRFTRGLEQLQGLLEYQPIYLVVPDVKSDFAARVRQVLRGYAWVKLIQIPLRYPFDNFTILARALGFKVDPDDPVWALRTEGVLAIDRALTLSHPCTVRIVSLAGPGVVSPLHLKAIPGYPLQAILQGRGKDAPLRVIDGGVLTGETVGEKHLGLQAECSGLTVLAEQTDRELLSFARPGWNRRSYSRCFLSSLRGAFVRCDTTGLRGEKRPCVGCGLCENVCPARIMPHLIHRLLYADELEQIERVGLDLCAACGLCSYVCPSKIELLGEIYDAREAIERELHRGDGSKAPTQQPSTSEVGA